MMAKTSKRAVCGEEFEDPYDSGNFVECGLPPHSYEFWHANKDVARAAEHMLDRRFRLPRKPPFTGGLEGRRYLVQFVIDAVVRAVSPKKRPGEDFEVRCEDIAGVIRGPLKERIEHALIGTKYYSEEDQHFIDFASRQLDLGLKLVEEYKAKLATLDAEARTAKGNE